ncbi:MAG: vanadium-dependent haloperoxidase [Bacteroidota bacterium]
MKIIKLFSSIFILLHTFCIVYAQNNTTNLAAKINIHQLNNTLVNVLVEDRFSPPVASRIHAYCNLAYYEVLHANDATKSFSNLLPNYHCNDFLSSNDTNNELAATMAFIQVAIDLTFSTHEWNELIHKINSDPNDSIRFNQYKIQNEKWIQSYLKWTKEDGFKQRLSKEIYTLSTSYKDYKLTPPAYKPALESHWGELRPFLIQNKKDFETTKKIEMDTAVSSPFYKLNQQVYQEQINQDSSHIKIAFHWDCNPIQVKTISHARLYNFRMTPASHWISITANILQKENINTQQSAYIYTVMSLAMADAFISCWSDKYRYNSIRPITYINAYMDEEWNSLIETPNFPEYPSGHSLVSSCAATILSHFLGKHYTFTDVSQIKYGQSSRTYHSFYEAAKEAGLSRFYGGIHYIPSINDGYNKGILIGKYVCGRIKKIK